MILAHNSAPPERAAVVFDWLAKELTTRSNGAWQVEYAGNTILTKEIDIINAVKTGNIAMGTPVGAAATIFPEMGVFLVPYLISSYDQAYKTFNGDVGDQLDKTFQEKYGVKVLYFFDFGFRHFWNRVRPITTPRDLRGLKIRVQPSKVFADTINGLGGVAVPVPGAEIYTAAQQGVVDGGDMPVANMVPLKLYEVSKYYSLTNHNYGASLLAINLGVWKTLSSDEQKLLLSTGKEAQAQAPAIDRELRFARRRQGPGRAARHDRQCRRHRRLQGSRQGQGVADLPGSVQGDLAEARDPTDDGTAETGAARRLSARSRRSSSAACCWPASG